MQVQEQLDFQYYVSAYRTDADTWKDVTLMDRLSYVPGGHTPGHQDNCEQTFGECDSHFCVSVPGQSEWLQANNLQSTVHTSAGTVVLQSAAPIWHPSMTNYSSLSVTVTGSSPGKGKRARECADHKELETENEFATVASNTTSSKHRRYMHDQTVVTAQEGPPAVQQASRGRGCIVEVSC